MKIKKALLFALVILAASVSMILNSEKINAAAAPATLQVGMAYRPYGSTGTVPLNMGVSINVVRKTTSNGIVLPSTRSPYFGNHLDTDNNGSPNTNDFTAGLGTDGNYANTFGGTYASSTFPNLTWCGQILGVPPKEFQLDVSVIYGTSTTIEYGGRTVKGTWTGFYNFEAPATIAEKGFFNGRSVRVPVYNPYRNFVYFEFKEAAPEYGTLSAGKYATGQPIENKSISNGSSQFINIARDTRLVSSNGAYEFFFDSSDGLIKIYDRLNSPKKLVKSYGQSDASKTGKNYLRLQDDGNFVLRNSDNLPIWDSGPYVPNTAGREPTDQNWVAGPVGYTAYGSLTSYTLLMQDDGNLSVYKTGGGYLSTSSTLRVGDDHPVLASTPAAVAGAQVKYFAAYGTNPRTYTQFYPNSTASDIEDSKLNPTDRSNVDANQGPFKAEITIPKGWDLKSSFIMKENGAGTKATPNASCAANSTDGTQTCSIIDIQVEKGITTYIDYVMQPESPKGYIDDVCNTIYASKDTAFFTARNTTKEATDTQVWGWAYDPTLVQVATDKTKTPSRIIVKFDEGKPTEGKVEGLADYQRNDVNAVYPGYGNFHGFFFSVPLKYFDGRNHTAKAYVDKNGDGTILLQLPRFDDSKNDLTFNCGDAYFPWLQTKQGNVVADGKISGQYASEDGVDFLGGRSNIATEKEAEFLIISAVADGGPFCSTYNYILTNTSALLGSCSNGAGYSFATEAMDAANNADKVINGVKQAFADNGASTTSAQPDCSGTNSKRIATATLSSLPTSSTTNLSTACEGGVIYKLNSANIGNILITQGRVTLLVDQNAFINGTIYYSAGTGPSVSANPLLSPGLTIVVNGNVGVSSGIGSVNASIYSSGKIDTCTVSSATDTNTAQNCSANQLKINGSLVSKNGYNFSRTFNNSFRDPSELIILKPQNIPFPSPGIESRYFFNDFSLYKLDTSEYNPRF
jgi:hypothetical protein